MIIIKNSDNNHFPHVKYQEGKNVWWDMRAGYIITTISQKEDYLQVNIYS